MEIEEFKKYLKTCKKSTSQKYLDVKVKKYTEIKRFEIYKESEICSKCGNVIKKSVVADFNRQIEHLTIFEAQLLYSLFVLKKIPYDYAQFHKSQAGKEFIENIKNVVVE